MNSFSSMVNLMSCSQMICFISSRTLSKSEAIFWKVCYSWLQMAWPCSRTPRVYIVSYSALSRTPYVSFPTTYTSNTMVSARSYGYLYSLVLLLSPFPFWASIKTGSLLCHLIWGGAVFPGGKTLPPKPKGAHLTLSFLLHAGWRWEVQSPLSFTLEDMSLAYPRLLVPKNFTEMSIRPLNLHSMFFRSLQCMCLIKASSTLAHCSSGPSWCSARYLGSIGLLRLGRERAGSLTALGQDGNCVLLSALREYELWSLLLMGKEMKHTHQVHSFIPWTWEHANVR